MESKKTLHDQSKLLLASLQKAEKDIATRIRQISNETDAVIEKDKKMFRATSEERLQKVNVERFCHASLQFVKINILVLFLQNAWAQFF